MEKFGKYELLDKIAMGGMAEIWLARKAGATGYDELLVVKRILPHLVESEEFVQMFLHEARVAVRLNHPNVVQISDLGAQDGSFFIAMEYIHGEDARRIWRQSLEMRQAVPVPLVCRIVADAAAGLDYAHKRTDPAGKPLNIIHRDVSPQNILVSFDGAVKVVDFGIAKAADQSSHTRTGVLKGKYSYMSPEQANGKDIDQRTDQFALGVVLYELTTLQRLFKRDSDIKTLQAVASCDVPLPSQISPRVPKELEAIILKSLAKDPDQRFRDLREMQLALEGWLSSARQPSSQSHLADYLGRIYQARLSREKALGRPLFSDEPIAASPVSAPPVDPKPAVTKMSPRRTGAVPTVAAPHEPEKPPPPVATPEQPLALAKDRTPIVLGAGGDRESRTSTTLSRVVRNLLSRKKLVIGAAAIAVAFASGATALLLTRGPTPVEPTVLRDPVTPLPAAKPSAVKIVTRPEGASIQVDGELQTDRAPLTVRGLAAGEHEVVAKLKGYSEARRKVTLREGKTEPLVMELEALPASETVKLTIATVPPGAELTLDGKKLGISPATTTLPASAQVELLASLEGYVPRKRALAIGTGPEQEVTLELDKRISTAPPPHPEPRPHDPPKRDPPRPEPVRRDPPREPPKPEPSGPGTLAVSCEPQATVFEGGTELGRTPLETKLSPGTHELTLINLEQGLRKPFTAVIRSGASAKESFRFQKGEVQFIVVPGADVYLNKRKMVQIPGPKFGVVEGEHVFELRNDELNKTRQVPVTVRPGQVTKVKVNLLED